MSLAQILTHMNRDHKTSLHDYLEYYGGVHIDLDAADSVTLRDVKLNELTLDYTKAGAARTITIPLDPPMSGMQEARDRFISMAFEAARGLHVSPYRISQYTFPRGALDQLQFAGLGVGVVTTAVLGFSKAAAARAGVLAHASKLRGLFFGILAIHVAEFLFAALPLLRRFRSPRAVVVKYLLTTGLVGYPAWTPLKHEADRLRTRESQQ